MKRMIAVLLCLLLAGCSAETKNADKTQATIPQGDECAQLIGGNWEGSDSQCVNVIKFKEDGGFSNWCYCGSPVGDSDLVSQFRYHGKDQTFTLYSEEQELIETGKILFQSPWNLVVFVWGRSFVYKNLDAARPTVTLDAMEVMGLTEADMACVRVEGYADGVLTVTECAATDSSPRWELETTEGLCSQLVTADGQSANHEGLELLPHNAYLYFERDGKVSRLVYYADNN